MIDAIAFGGGDRASELATTVRQLIEETTLVLGVRRRRFVYQPPDGWHPLANSLLTNWYPSDFPGTSACITVPPATPSQSFSVDDLVEASLAELEIEQRAARVSVGPSSFSQPGGLSGTAWTLDIDGPDQSAFVRDIVVLADRLYGYPLRLDLRPGPHSRRMRAAFSHVVNSVEPLVRTARSAPAAAAAFDIWCR